MPLFEQVTLAAIMIVPGAVAAVAGLVYLRRSGYLPQRSLVPHVALVLALGPGIWLAMAGLEDLQYGTGSTAALVVPWFAVLMPFVLGGAAFCFAGPLWLLANIPPIGAQLRTPPPGVQGNATALAGIVLAAGAWFAVAQPQTERNAMFHAIRIQSAGPADLLRYGKIAAANLDNGLGVALERSPAATPQMFSALIDPCLAGDLSGPCEDWLYRIAYNGRRKLPLEVVQKIDKAIGSKLAQWEGLKLPR